MSCKCRLCRAILFIALQQIKSEHAKLIPSFPQRYNNTYFM